MPLILDTPENVSINCAKIVAFRVVSEPLSIEISYVRGVEDAAGFKPIDGGTSLFNEAAIDQVDPTGSIRSELKDACYQLLESVVGKGTIE